MPIQQIRRSFGTLSDAVRGACPVSAAFNALDDYMRENSATWRSEARNAFQKDELLTSLLQAFVEDDNPRYTVTLGGGALTFNKGNEFVAKFVFDDDDDDDDGSSSNIMTVAVEGPTAPAGFEVDGAHYVQTVRHVSDAFKAAKEHSPLVRQLIDALRAGSPTFKQNYDHSYVTQTEMLMAAIEFTAHSASTGYTVSFVGGKMTFLRQNVEVIALGLGNDAKVGLPAAANFVPTLWTLVS